MNKPFIDEALEQTNEEYLSNYYEGIFGDPHGLLPQDKAEPIIHAYIDMAVNEIEMKTGRKTSKWEVLADLSDYSWKFVELDDDENEYTDIDTVAMLLEDIVQDYLEMYEDYKTSGIKYPAPAAKMPK